MQPSITTRGSRFDLHNVRLAAAITGVFVAGMILGGLSREIDISNPFDDDARPAVVAHVPSQAGEGLMAVQQEGIGAGVPAITGGPGDVYSFDNAQFREQNLVLPDAGVTQAPDYSLDWARFLEANGVTGALTEPVVSIQHQRFLEENIYLPGYEVETQTTTPLSGEDVPLYLPGNTPTPFTNEDILFLEQNLYLPSDGVGFIDLEPLPMPVERRADLKAYYEAGMGQGWFAYGRPADATDDAAQPRDTSNRREGAEVGRPAPDGRHSKGKR
mgnify:CR=1 FL=1